MLGVRVTVRGLVHFLISITAHIMIRIRIIVDSSYKAPFSNTS